MPAVPRTRVDGYVRVSRVGKRRGPSFISPTVQREAIEEWAARNGFELMDVFEELDESGARADRPLLEKAVERIEIGASSAMVVWRVDRFGRSLNDEVQIIERIRAVGGGFYSVQDGLDIGTEAGRLALRILLSVAEFQREGVRASWDAAREHAIRRGVHVCPAVPVGYRRTRAGRLRPHPVTAPIITEAYRRRAAGDSLRMLCDYMREQGVRTGKGNPGWSTGTMGRALRSRVYLGEVGSGRFVRSDAHPALTDSATWQAAQRPRNLRRHEPLPALLVGLARCAGCSHCLQAFIARPPGREPYLNYRCRKHHAAGSCPAPAIITATKLEPYVIEAVLELLRRRRRAPANCLAVAVRRAELAAEALARYRDNDRVALVIGRAAFVDGLEVRQERLRDARLDVVDTRARAAPHTLPPVGEVRRQLPTMTHAEKRELLSKVIDMVFVTQGRRPASQRITVCPAGTAPRILPRQGDKGRVLRSIQPRRAWLNPSVEPAKP